MVLAWSDVMDGIGVAQTGEREDGRARLMEFWHRTQAADHAQRCVLAHYLADVQDALPDELAWDERALEEHAYLSEDAFLDIGIPTVRGLLPSLHLNLADGYLRSGETASARQHLQLGVQATDALGDDGYAAMVRSGLQRLAGRLADISAEGPL